MMKGKVCLVTGATNGIGKEIARNLAGQGATVLLHGRNRAKAEQVREELRLDTGNHEIHVLIADFASLDDVRALAEQVRDLDRGLHVLANNAGLLTDHRQVSADGFELTFAVNQLAPFLLTQLLLPILKSSSPSSISFNSSSAMGSAAVRFDDLQMEQRFDGWTAYANTKQMNFWTSNLLSERLAGDGVVSNAYCPGLIDTDLLTGNRDFGEARIKRMRAQMRTSEDGAMTAVFLASSPDASDINGAFFLKSHDSGRMPLVLDWDRDAACRLWDISLNLVSGWLD